MFVKHGIGEILSVVESDDDSIDDSVLPRSAQADARRALNKVRNATTAPVVTDPVVTAPSVPALTVPAVKTNVEK